MTLASRNFATRSSEKKRYHWSSQQRRCSSWRPRCQGWLNWTEQMTQMKTISISRGEVIIIAARIWRRCEYMESLSSRGRKRERREFDCSPWLEELPRSACSLRPKKLEIESRACFNSDDLLVNSNLDCSMQKLGRRSDFMKRGSDMS